MKVLIAVSLLIGILWFITWAVENARKVKLYHELKPKIDDLEKKESELKKNLEEFERRVEREKTEIIKITEEKSLGFPWLASAYADYFYLEDLKIANYL